MVESVELPKPSCDQKAHREQGGCYRCCEDCNYATHRCHFCGSELTHNDYDSEGNHHTTRYCRPDLFEHEIGETCTWWPVRHMEQYKDNHYCYAFYDNDTKEWTGEHIHFH